MTGLPEDLQPWSRVTETKGKPGATWAVGVLQPRRRVLARGEAGSAKAAQEALSQACARLCETYIADTCDRCGQKTQSPTLVAEHSLCEACYIQWDADATRFLTGSKAD